MKKKNNGTKARDRVVTNDQAGIKNIKYQLILCTICCMLGCVCNGDGCLHQTNIKIVNFTNISNFLRLCMDFNPCVTYIPIKVHRHTYTIHSTAHRTYKIEALHRFTMCHIEYNFLFCLLLKTMLYDSCSSVESGNSKKKSTTTQQITKMI